MLERFTPATRIAIDLAWVEARETGHRKIGTKHLLLGLVRDETGRAAALLRALGAAPAAVRLEVARILGERSKKMSTLADLEKKGFKPLKARRAGDFHAAFLKAVSSMLEASKGTLPPDALARLIVNASASFAKLPAPKPVRDFTPRAQKILSAAAERAGASKAGPEELLVALHDAPDGVAARALAALGVTRERLAAEIEKPFEEILEELPGPPEEVSCPHGHGPLELVLREGVTLAICPECCATVLPPGELEQLVARLAEKHGLSPEQAREALRRFLDPPAE